MQNPFLPIKDTDEIEKWLEYNEIDDYEILEDGTVNVFENVILKNITPTLPIKFGIIDGFIQVRADNIEKSLKTLEGFPSDVKAIKLLKQNIKDLSGISEKCKSLTFIDCENLTSLNGLEQCKNYSSISFNNCGIKNLVGINSVMEKVMIEKCDNFNSLKGISKEIVNLIIEDCKNLTSLKYLNNVHQYLNIKNCGITSLKGLVVPNFGLLNILKDFLPQYSWLPLKIDVDFNDVMLFKDELVYAYARFCRNEISPQEMLDIISDKDETQFIRTIKNDIKNMGESNMNEDFKSPEKCFINEVKYSKLETKSFNLFETLIKDTYAFIEEIKNLMESNDYKMLMSELEKILSKNNLIQNGKMKIELSKKDSTFFPFLVEVAKLRDMLSKFNIENSATQHTFSKGEKDLVRLVKFYNLNQRNDKMVDFIKNILSQLVLIKDFKISF